MYAQKRRIGGGNKSELLFLSFDLLGEELCKLADPSKLNGAGGTVTVFRNDTFGNALFACAGLFIIFVSVKEHDDIRVLLDRTGISKVGKHRAFIRTAFGSTGELCATDNGNLQFFC